VRCMIAAQVRADRRLLLWWRLCFWWRQGVHRATISSRANKHTCTTLRVDEVFVLSLHWCRKARKSFLKKEQVTNGNHWRHNRHAALRLAVYYSLSQTCLPEQLPHSSLEPENAICLLKLNSVIEPVVMVPSLYSQLYSSFLRVTAYLVPRLA
jgi:hypothetical protein